MNNTIPITKIYMFNKDAGLLSAGYNDARECAFPIEEALEGFNLGLLQAGLYVKDGNAKEISRAIISNTDARDDNFFLADVDRLDKHLDTIVFAFGSIFKLGLNVEQALEALDVVMTANMQKLKAGKDEHGKQMKPENFVGPEIELQKILDRR